MNFRRIVMVSGSHFLKRVCTTVAAPASSSVENSHLWRRSCTTSSSPLTAAGVKADLFVKNDGYSGSAKTAKVTAREQRKKRKMFKELRVITEKKGRGVKNTLNEFIKREETEGVSITQEDLFGWAKQLDNFGKHIHACQIYEWMDRKKMTFPPTELANYIGLVDKTKGLLAAIALFKRVEPNFDRNDPHAKNLPAYRKLRGCAYSQRGNYSYCVFSGRAFRCTSDPAVLRGESRYFAAPAVLRGPSYFPHLFSPIP